MTGEEGGEHTGLAPVIPIFGARAAEKADANAEGDDTVPAQSGWVNTWGHDAPHDGAPHDDDEEHADGDDDDGDDARGESAGGAESTREVGEKRLLKKLRARALSVSESKKVLRECHLDATEIEVVIESLGRLGYLDDAALAEQLVHVGVQRKGQGRQALGMSMAKRGIARDVADAAIAALPDDDAERALDFARQRARSLDKVEADAALRRLVGALARRGYRGSVAMSAAREALAERAEDRPRGSSSSVRFR